METETKEKKKGYYVVIRQKQTTSGNGKGSCDRAAAAWGAADFYYGNESGPFATEASAENAAIAALAAGAKDARIYWYPGYAD